MNSANARQATLPEKLEGHTVDKMTVGEVGYTLPWGMWVDENRNCWLHPKYSVESAPHGTLEMKVARLDDGYHVWAPPGKTWVAQSEPSYASPADTQFIPVADLHP